MAQNFTLAEMCHSQLAVRRGIDNTPSPAVIANLDRMMLVLEAIRYAAGAPVTVSSGYRSPAVNAAVGGTAGSAHVLGLAADINCTGMPAHTLATLIRNSGIAFDQLIYEGTWVHVGISVGKPRQMCLTAKFHNGKATYLPGIENI